MKKLRVMFILPLLAMAAACTTIDTGNSGVFVEYGKPVESVREGFYWFNPWSTDVIPVSVQSQKWTSKTLAYTKDVQQANVEFALTYHLDPNAVLTTYRNYGIDWNNKIIPQAVFQSVKNTIGRSRAVEDVINNRQAITSTITNELIQRFSKRGIIIDGFEIQDVAFNQAFEEAVERKQIAVQDAETAKNKTTQIQEEANQKIITAKAEAEAMQIKTAALSGNSKLVDYEIAKKWDGVLPQYMMGNGTSLFNIK